MKNNVDLFNAPQWFILALALGLTVKDVKDLPQVRYAMCHKHGHGRAYSQFQNQKHSGSDCSSSLKSSRYPTNFIKEYQWEAPHSMQYDLKCNNLHNGYQEIDIEPLSIVEEIALLALEEQNRVIGELRDLIYYTHHQMEYHDEELSIVDFMTKANDIYARI